MKRKRSEKISFRDLVYLKELLRTKLPLSDCLELLSEPKNEAVLKQIREKLDRGEGAEEAFRDHLPEELEEHIYPLMKALPFLDSLSLALSFTRQKKEGVKEILTVVTYPFVLLFLSMSALYLFDEYGLDGILSLLKSFSGDLGSFLLFRRIFRILIRTFYTGFLILLLVFLYFSSKKRRVFFYVLLSKYLPDSLIHTYYSREFVGLYLELLRSGYSSKPALEILKSLKKRPVVSFLAYHLDEDLSEGESMETASSKPFYDASLSRFIRIASYSGNFEAILENYLEIAGQKIASRAKGLTLFIQIFSYVMIGLAVLFVYQILFLPMQAISAL